jgi:hypothetical protein
MTMSANYGVTIDKGNVEIYCMESGVPFFQMNAFVERQVCVVVKKRSKLLSF